MKKVIYFIFLSIYIFVSLVFILYLVLPDRKFPDPPSDSVQSLEKADTESPLRRAYFTNYTRDEVMNHYYNQFNKIDFLNLYLPTLRLNYPPEESQTLIRDQTRSTFLEEFAHPFRESLFVNGFEPKQAKDEIWYKGVHYRQKIIIKYVPNSPLLRILIAIPTIVFGWVLLKEIVNTRKVVLKNG